jgi:nucleotide-binding universal stress UspA family protein
MSTRTRVVVGIDRSEGSRAALRHAARQAAAHDAELVVVHAWESAFEHVHDTQTTDVLRATALQSAVTLLDDVLAEAVADPGWAVQRVTVRPVQGEASTALLATVRQGDLLVVGKNRGDLLRRVLLGSVSSRVLRAARCPVVVVPASQRRGSRRAQRRSTAHPVPAALTTAGP